MAKGKGKKGKRRGDDSDEEDAAPAAPPAAADDAGLSRKEKRSQKAKGKQPPPPSKQPNKRGGGDDSDDGSDDDAPAADAPQKKLTKKQLKRQKEREEAEARAKADAEAEAAMDDGSDEEEDAGSESEEEAVPQPAKKGKQKKGKKGKQADSENEDDAPAPAKKLTKKQLKRQKEKEEAEARAKADAEAEAALMDDSESEVEVEEEVEEEPAPTPEPVKKLTKKQLKKQKEKEAQEARAKADAEAEAALMDESESEVEEEEEEEEEVVVPEPAKKLTKKQLKKQKEKEEAEAAAKAAVFDESDDSDDDGGVAEEMEKLEIVEEDEGKKKKKDKKEKGKKKTKLEKKLEEAARLMAEAEAEVAAAAKAAGVDDSSEEEEEEMDEEAKEKALKKKERAEKKEAKEAKRAAKAEKEAAKEAKKAAKAAKKAAEDGDGEGEGEAKGDADEDEDEVFYGAPDDKAWTDNSQAIKDADEKKDEGPDQSLLFDKNGKKLSNKQRKLLIKAREAEARAEEYELTAAKNSAEGAQFACSQTAVNENDPQWQNSLDINIPNFSISAAGKILFKEAAFNVAHGRRYGLVGPNGKGKSTLLKMIASKDLVLPPRVDFLYVEQEVEASNTSAVDAVLKADKVRWELLEEETALSKAIDEGEDDAKTFTRLQEVLDELNSIGAASAEAKARRILFGLGFDGEMQSKPTKMFSGGWRMRISLARALFIEPTLLMLDEPTNHLDLNAVIWLDNYLLTWKKTLLIVSHDQDFLNSVCDEILHIEELALASYKGNYDSFKKAEATKLKVQLKNYEKQEKKLKELKRQGQSKAKATETVKKNKREPGARAAKKKNDAIASGSATAEKATLITRPREYTVQISFADVAELSRPVMEVNRVHFRYSEKHPVIFDQIDFGIDTDSRICIVGPNGAGKSTLLKLLTGEIKAVKGDVKRNPRLRMGIYNQHFVDRLPMDKTPVEHLRDRFQEENYQTVRNRLGKYGLEGHAHEVTMRDLSGGQKARVVFVELSLQRPHILLLDEPTNNLDIETIDALIQAINLFNGGIVVVTHDQRLIDECNCTLWVVEKEGVTRWDAGFDDYKEGILTELEEQAKRDEAKHNERMETAAKKKAEKLAGLRAKAI